MSRYRRSCNRPGKVFGLSQPLIQDGVEPPRFGPEAFLRIGRLAGIELQEVVRLPQHRPGAAHLEHQPLPRPPAAGTILGNEFAGLFGEIQKDGAGFHERRAGVVIDDGRDLVVGTDLQEVGRELLVLRDIDRMHSVGKPGFLQHDGSLAPIGRGPGVQVDHGAFFLSQSVLRCPGQ